MSKKALVTGITGQVGSFMALYLMDRGFEVHGLNRRKSVDNNKNIDRLLTSIQLIEGDICDPHCINHIIQAGQYDCVVNLAAQSHVHTSFEQPQYTFEVDTIGVLNILEAIRHYSKHTRLYQASTSELYGSSKPPQNENTPLMPQSPYGCAKIAAHHLVRIYSAAYGLKAACGIMFNTESRRRGDNFVTKKITNWAQTLIDGIKTYKQCKTLGWALPTLPVLTLGNMDAKRDWSHALDSVDAIYRILYQDEFNKNFDGTWQSYCFGSGKAYSVRDFLVKVEAHITNATKATFIHTGTGLDEQVSCVIEGDSVPVVTVDPKFYRPAEVDFLLSDPTKIKTELGWNPKFDLDMLIDSMVNG